MNKKKIEIEYKKKIERTLELYRKTRSLKEPMRTSPNHQTMNADGSRTVDAHHPT